MIKFVNAKINLGLQIVRRRQGGYHDLQTLFYPVGLKAGTPANPVEFCDILEICRSDSERPFTLVTTGRAVDCAPEKNLVWRAAEEYFRLRPSADFAVSIRLDKHLPDGAGMGGGSADAAFTLAMIDSLAREHDPDAGLSPGELASAALRLGADCPFFLINRPAYAEGVGERLEEIPLDLSGMWLGVAKPAVSVSTREAFAGVRPRPSTFDLRTLPDIPVADWSHVVVNDFEESIFPQCPLLADIKAAFYEAGALYASMTGSGSCIYGLWPTRDEAREAMSEIARNPTITHTYLLEL